VHDRQVHCHFVVIDNQDVWWTTHGIAADAANYEPFRAMPSNAKSNTLYREIIEMLVSFL
jgi:hypothetical protein